MLVLLVHVTVVQLADADPQAPPRPAARSRSPASPPFCCRPPPSRRLCSQPPPNPLCCSPTNRRRAPCRGPPSSPEPHASLASALSCPAARGAVPSSARSAPEASPPHPSSAQPPPLCVCLRCAACCCVLLSARLLKPCSRAPSPSPSHHHRLMDTINSGVSPFIPLMNRLAQPCQPAAQRNDAVRY